ncbi:hypothetical protein LCGC14_0428840 [marine sediment metagenome]|uniref:Uncharacterized protein n=1 Tax=marine sediment metagenome TaxID=412755 RepID=A0A0F9VAM1_9ZZZZ
MITMKLHFDPSKSADPDVVATFRGEVAQTLYLLWRRGHIVSQGFFKEVLQIASRIKSEQPTTVTGLAECFGARWMDPLSNFPKGDIETFCLEALPYFIGEQAITYKMEVTNEP